MVMNLEKIKREYKTDFGANTVLMLQIELTHTIADRWYKNNSKCTGMCCMENIDEI